MLVQRLTLICCSLSGELGWVRWLVPVRCAFKGDECCAFKGDEGCAFKGDEGCAFKGDECSSAKE